jgi:hypothetical protein
MTLVSTTGVDHLDATQVIVRRRVEEIQQAWRSGLDMGALRASFAAFVAPVFVAAVSTGQTQAASLVEPYVASVMEATGADPIESTSNVVPAGFAGVTASGLPLVFLADLMVIRLLADIAAGLPVVDASARGLRRALLYAATEITDAGRIATQAQMVGDRRVAGYERVVKLPACGRCVILAGRLYRYSTGFRRHPRCDCTMLPVTADQWRASTVDNHPKALFESMTRPQQDAAFGARNAEAIRAGADLSQVVNARSGAMLIAGRWTTTVGTTSRGLAGMRMGELHTRPGRRYRMSQVARPTAGQLILDHAHGSRAELVAALHRYGYLR